MSLPGADATMTAVLTDFVIGFNKFIIVYFALINLGYLSIFWVSLRSLWRFVRRIFVSDYSQIRQSDLTLPISLLVPAFNESKTIVESLRSLLALNYGEFEIIVINDGSTDDTLERLVQTFDLRRTDTPLHMRLKCNPINAIYRSMTHANLTVLDKLRGGKADALNAGLNASRYPLFCSIDADSLIEEEALLRLVKPFIEFPNETVAAGGIVRVANGCVVSHGHVVEARLPRSGIAVMQVVEYLRAFLAGRAGWSSARALLIISGAFGLFRKREVVEVGGYSSATDTEDAELVVRLHRHLCDQDRKYRIVFVPDPVCWTEVPESMRVLTRQRERWHRGLLQTLWMNRGMMFRPKYGAVGMFGIPWYVAFELLAPVVEVLGYIMVPLAWFLGILDRTYLILFLIVAFVVGALLSMGALVLEEISFRRYPRWRDLLRLLAYGFLENFGFRQYLSFVKVNALFQALRRRRQWGDMKRRGFKQKKPPATDAPEA
ncbi:MAG: glycosyltransferase family 2 protein [Gammaproteobacteria bacterium]|nr:glycosyltransferase family 2 protein [Gammaproteobacteria bacterium]